MFWTIYSRNNTVKVKRVCLRTCTPGTYTQTGGSAWGQCSDYQNWAGRTCRSGTTSCSRCRSRTQDRFSVGVGWNRCGATTPWSVRCGWPGCGSRTSHSTARWHRPLGLARLPPYPNRILNREAGSGGLVQTCLETFFWPLPLSRPSFFNNFFFFFYLGLVG